MKSAGLFKKIIVYILLTCFIFPTHALYGAAISSKEDKDPFVNFKKQHSKYIKEYISLDISDVKDVSKYLVKISSYIKKTVDSGLIYDISKETDERYWSEDINQSWLSLLVLQYKLAEYINLIKSSVDQEAVIAELTNTKIDNFRSYLYTLYRNVDDVLAENPDITVTELETGEKAIRYPGVEASTNTAVTQDEVLLPTGLAFPESLIKEKNNWGDLAGILENYESEKYTTIIGIQLGLDLNEFIKSKNYNKMKEYKKAIFEGARAFLRAKPGAVTRIANLMALQQLYENLYFEALGNALRIYMDNIYVYKASTDFSRLNEEGIKELAELACPLIDERKTSDTDYRTAEYARYRCIKKMVLVVKDQIKIIANNPDIYKKQTLKELTTEINTALIPLITAVREDLAKSIGVSTSSVMNGDINYVQDCPKTEGAVKTYFATLSFIVNQYKGARFLYADEDLREEYFENPVSTFKPGRTGRSEIDPMCQVTFSSMGKTVTEEEITEAFDQSQTALVNYAIELNTAYQNIVDDFLRQKYSTSYNTKNYKLLNAAGLWETTGEATGLEPNGDWYGEALEEQNNCLDAIIVILKTTPTAAQKVYKEDPKLYEVNSIVNNYLKNIRISDQRDAEFRSYVGIVGMVVGTLLILTFFGSEAGMALIGISEGSVAATTIAATSTAITAVGTPVFVASLGYETANNIKDNNKFEKEENKTVTSVSNGEDADLEYLDYLNESEAEAVSSAMVNGFFTALGVAGGIARVVEYLGFLNKEAAIKWYAELSETINTDPEFAFKCELLNKKLLTGNSSEKFDLLIRYAQEAGLTTSDIKSNAMFYIDSDINFLQKNFSKQGLRLFKDWYAKSVKQINQEAGNKILKIVTTDEESSLWNRELTEFLIKNPEIKEPLSEALGGMTQKDVYSFLEELANMRPDDAAKILKGFKNSSISTKITNFINTIKPSTKYLETLNHKLKSFLSSMVNMEPEIVDEALTPEIIARFPTFHKANNWTNKLATLKKTDGSPINEAVLSRYLRVDSEGELQINSCRMKQTECSEQHSDVNYYTDIGPKLGKILKGSNFDDFAEKWVLAPAIGDGKYTLKWFKVKMVTRNFSKQAYEKELARQNAKGVFKNIKDDFANDPEALKKLKFYWITRVQPTMEQPGVENACVEAWRTIFDCYDIETTSRWARIELSLRKLIWPPEGYPPGHPLYNK